MTFLRSVLLARAVTAARAAGGVGMWRPPLAGDCAVAAVRAAGGIGIRRVLVGVPDPTEEGAA